MFKVAKGLWPDEVLLICREEVTGKELGKGLHYFKEELIESEIKLKIEKQQFLLFWRRRLEE